jgi:hypothetical protein
LSETDFGKRLGVEGPTIRGWGEVGWILRCYNNHPQAGYDWQQPKWLYLWNDSIHIWYEDFAKKREWTDVPRADYTKMKWYDYEYFLRFGKALIEQFDNVENHNRQLVIDFAKRFNQKSN